MHGDGEKKAIFLGGLGGNTFVSKPGEFEVMPDLTTTTDAR